MRAVRDGRVYTMPNAPFAWCDRPPGVNRFLGIQWVANMLYPDLYDVDMVEVTKDFYSRMYWVDITDEQARDLLGNSYPVYRPSQAGQGSAATATTSSATPSSAVTERTMGAD